VLFTYVTLKKKAKVSFLTELFDYYKRQEIKDKLTSRFSTLPKHFGELLERAYKGTLESTNMIEGGILATVKKFATNMVGGAITCLSATAAVKHAIRKNGTTEKNKD
jgi:hypothetical protein